MKRLLVLMITVLMLFGILAPVASNAAAMTAREFVAQCYRGGLGREGSDGEIDQWLSLVRAGVKTMKDVPKEIFLSEESRNRRLLNEEFVQVLYRLFFGREADGIGMKFWTEKLRNGTSPTEAANAFADSDEFKTILKNLQ